MRFRAILLAILNATPKTPPTPYWSCREAAFAHLVIESTDEELWRALLAVARRVDVGLRMELMNPMSYSNKPNRQRRARFLAEFLDDAAVRDSASNPGMYDGPSAAFTFPRIAVRDFAAM